MINRCFPKSKHVSHLPGNKREYKAAVHDFLELAYFSKMPSEEKIDLVQSTTSQVLELEEEEFEEQRRASAA